MENYFTSTLTQVAEIGSSHTNVANVFCGKKKYCPPSAKCMEVESMAILAGSNPVGSTNGDWKTSKETTFEANDFEFTEDYMDE